MTIKRLNYFNGQFLRENDFNLEQDYHLSLRRLHNRKAHTPGIISGLEVVAGNSQVTVKAGMAIDKDGREIIVETDTTVNVSAGDNGAHVVIALDERKSDPAVAPDPIRLETRWTESAALSLVGDVPASAVALAQIATVAANGAVTLNSSYRRLYSAPVVEGDLAVGRDLTVSGNLEVKGQTTLIETDQMRGDVVLGDADADTVRVAGTLLSAHSSGQLQLTSPVNMSGNLAVQGNLEVHGSASSMHGDVVLGDADTASVTIAGSLHTAHSTGTLKIASPVDIAGSIAVSGTVDGRDLSADGSKLDEHVASTSNPHLTTAAQVDTQGGANSLVAQINAGTGVIAAAHIDNAIARETHFDTTTGHHHDGTDSKKISPSNLAGVSSNVTAANLNVLTAGPTSNAAALHTHPFEPADGSISLGKLDTTTRSRMLRVPLLAQLLDRSAAWSLGYSDGGIAFDGSHVWMATADAHTILKIDPATNSIIATLDVGNSPIGLAFGGGYLWVADNWSASVSKVDVVSNTVVATIDVEHGANALAVSGGNLWVANGWSASVSKIDMASDTVVATIPVGEGPSGLAVVGNFVWVANSGSDSLSKIEMASDSVVATVSVGSQPRGLAAATGTFIWVANYGTNTVSKIDVGANTVVATVTVDHQPANLAVIGNFLWVGGNNNVQKVDTVSNEVVATVYAYIWANGNAMVSAQGFLWVIDQQRQLTKIDLTTNTVAARVVLFESRGMAFDGQHLWIALYYTDEVLKVDIGGQIVHRVRVGSGPHSVVYNGEYLFVTNSRSNSVSKIDPLTASVVATIRVGSNPTGIAYNSVLRTLWVANSGDGTASAFYEHETEVQGTYAVGANPRGVACASYYVWITNTDDNTVIRRWAGAGDDMVRTPIAVGAAPQAIVFDYSNMWVANTGAYSLSKIAINSNVATSVTLPTGALPSRMCFNGSHLIVPTATGITYRIDVHTDTVTTVNASLEADRNSPLAFDGLATWVVDNYAGLLRRQLL